MDEVNNSASATPRLTWRRLRMHTIATADPSDKNNKISRGSTEIDTATSLESPVISEGPNQRYNGCLDVRQARSSLEGILQKAPMVKTQNATESATNSKISRVANNNNSDNKDHHRKGIIADKNAVLPSVSESGCTLPTLYAGLRQAWDDEMGLDNNSTRLIKSDLAHESKSFNEFLSHFPTFRHIRNNKEMGTIIDQSQYAICLGFDPGTIPGRKLGIIVVPTGEEHMIFRSDGSAAKMPTTTTQQRQSSNPIQESEYDKSNQIVQKGLLPAPPVGGHNEESRKPVAFPGQFPRKANVPSKYAPTIRRSKRLMLHEQSGSSLREDRGKLATNKRRKFHDST